MCDEKQGNMLSFDFLPGVFVALNFGNSVDLNIVKRGRSGCSVSLVGIVAEGVESADFLGENNASSDDYSELEEFVVEKSKLEKFCNSKFS